MIPSSADLASDPAIVARIETPHPAVEDLSNDARRAGGAVAIACNAAGAAAIFESRPLERRFRGIHTVTQQLQGRLSHLETVGAWMVGAEANLTFV